MSLTIIGQKLKITDNVQNEHAFLYVINYIINITY